MSIFSTTSPIDRVSRTANGAGRAWSGAAILCCLSLTIVAGALAYRLAADPHATEADQALDSTTTTTTDRGEPSTGQELRLAAATVVLPTDSGGDSDGRSTGDLEEPARPTGDESRSDERAATTVDDTSVSSSNTSVVTSTIARVTTSTSARSEATTPTTPTTPSSRATTSSTTTRASTSTSSTARASTSPSSTAPAPTTAPGPAGPVAVDDFAAGSEGKGLKIKVLDNDAEGAVPLDEDSLVIVSGSDHADEYRVHDDHIHYKSVDDYSGTDRIRYRICDENGLCATATVVLTIED